MAEILELDFYAIQYKYRRLRSTSRILFEMVQNKSAQPKRLGRPRNYDPETALLRAAESFWKTGYAGTSLDEISAETGMNRPSLYAAFGDKRALYLKTLERYWQLSHAAMEGALADASLSLPQALMGAYEAQLAIYFSGPKEARGCFVIGTAVTEALEDAEVRHSLAEGFGQLDTALEARFRLARDKGELTADADPPTLAMLASAVLHSIAIRARTGTPRAVLLEIARKAVMMICGPLSSDF